MPFVDAIVLNAIESELGCPASHPDELIYELWPGTTGMCDCIEERGNEKYTLHEKCGSGGGGGPSGGGGGPGPGCEASKGRNPIV